MTKNIIPQVLIAIGIAIIVIGIGLKIGDMAVAYVTNITNVKVSCANGTTTLISEGSTFSEEDIEKSCKNDMIPFAQQALKDCPNGWRYEDKKFSCISDNEFSGSFYFEQP